MLSLSLIRIFSTQNYRVCSNDDEQKSTPGRIIKHMLTDINCFAYCESVYPFFIRNTKFLNKSFY